MRFFVVGDVSVDLIYFLDRIPEAGEEVPAKRALMKPGGAGATIAANLASLGHKVFLAARVGKDSFSDLALSRIKQTGVELKHLQEDAEHTTSSVLIFVVSGGERSMVSHPGANRYLDASEFRPRSLDQIDGLVVSAYALAGGPQREYAVKALNAAKKRNIPIFADLGSGAVRIAGKELLEYLKGVDYLLMNQHELLTLTGASSISEGVQALHAYELQRVIVKVGPLGSIVVTPEEQELVEPYPVEGVVDSTGAGDAYTAAFAHAILEGHDLLTAARMANIAGALVTTAVGAQGRLITREDLETPLHAAK
ncbi:carbohydrate kinase family protein [Marinithermus hydrothermalis]|uniref:PfkB domain protein n=1 Tax=Marinithermus hydrothermalis (strain DSM 14884 / JCM 11576 / T1) TaxID=869210 RepID=F2NQ89_MARHT|nr:carbohydrate kinase family protein [Marinithermus hydrothermalis]AEB11400.1 PfkB domain protein [Marinithermus hydrothermalis DSM 14884]